jgi:hypothetical protein
VRDFISRDSVTQFSELFLRNLRGLIDTSNQPRVEGDTRTIPILGISPSDFPLARSVLTQAQLDAEFGAEFRESELPVENILPLTPLQEGMLFDTLRDPNSELYVTQLVSFSLIFNFYLFSEFIYLLPFLGLAVRRSSRFDSFRSLLRSSDEKIFFLTFVLRSRELHFPRPSRTEVPQLR